MVSTATLESLAKASKLRRATSYLAKRALGRKAGAKVARKLKVAPSDTQRMECIQAQLDNGHQPDDLTYEEDAYFFPK